MVANVNKTGKKILENLAAILGNSHCRGVPALEKYP